MSWGGHEFYECPQPCDRLHCQFCEGGLAFCEKCKCGEGTLPSQCPGEPVSEEQQQNIYAGASDFRDGKWRAAPSGSVSSHYDGRPGLPEERS